MRMKRRWNQNEKRFSASYGTGLYPENKEGETWSDAQAQLRRIILATFWGWIVRASVEEANWLESTVSTLVQGMVTWLAGREKGVVRGIGRGREDERCR